MQTRSQSSVLGKRSHQPDAKPSTIDQACMPTPELTPKTKRARVSLCLQDGDSNKENVPPFFSESLGAFTTPSLARASTEIITPPRIQTTIARHASTPSIPTHPITPATSMSALALSTPPPTPHVTLLPIHARVRALLRSTCNGNAAISGRTVEQETIKAFVSSSWEDPSTASSLFVSGTPGTGKTAIVNAALTELGNSEVDVISVNCMAYQNVDALWDHLRDAFTASESIKTSPRKGKAKAKPLDDLLSSRKRKCLLVLDELDHIASSCRSFASVFLLSRKYATTLRIIGIANTHTLTASTALLDDDVAGISTLHFGGYTSSELVDVLNARLSPLYVSKGGEEAKKQSLKFLPPPTLALLAKKVASQTGDVRMLFGVLRGAIDMAISSSCPTADENPLAASVPTVTPNHVLSALKAYLPSNNNARGNATSASPSLNSEIATKVRGLGLHARLTLLSILLATKRMVALLPLSYSASFPPKTPVKRTGSMINSSKSYGLDLAQLHTYYSAVLERAEQGVFTPVSRSEFVDLIGVLETSGLVASSTSYSVAASPSKSGRRGFGRTTSFGGMAKGAAAGQDIRIADAVRTDEILRGLGVAESPEITDPREEEVRAIWIRENARITKDAKIHAQSKKVTDVIEGAFES